MCFFSPIEYVDAHACGVLQAYAEIVRSYIYLQGENVSIHKYILPVLCVFR